MTAWNPWKAFDAGVIAGLPTPGIMRIRNASSPRKWDERVGYGWSGSFPVFLGIRLSRFEISFELYDEIDWALWKLLEPVVAAPPAGKRPLALDIIHPILMPLGIRSIVVTDVKQIEVTPEGVATQVIEVMSFRKPRIALAKPEASKDSKPTDPYDAKIDALAAEVRARSLAP